MDILEATSSYELWLARFCEIHDADLTYKHQQMAAPTDAFPFFRGTYYRWVQHWSELCADLAAGPRVLAVGDLHIENFGTWRDTDARLVWGVNDFDEADELSYTNDLVRLAASIRFARNDGSLNTKYSAACRQILDGYRACLEAGGEPFVLEERHAQLRALAVQGDRDPVIFWRKFTKVLNQPEVVPPEAAVAALTHDLPAKGLTPQYRERSRVGMGSLGKPRYVALVDWDGGWVARETKTVVPPATAWAAGKTDRSRSRMAEIVKRAVRCPDPFYRAGSTWITRRLAPRCSRIELKSLINADDLGCVFQSMGAETANVHLGTPNAAASIIKDLDDRPKDWLPKAARTMAKAIEEDWKTWRRSIRKSAQKPEPVANEAYASPVR
ncbi:DUF2252 family protein [Fimbriiglobus ruber]|uniref:DUF2252 domain-containing protein n=1 Tax=Fimbriiglobus ruber TaxID=1908690 RepID=A0A225DG97_9BACT|nr:DUF2252 family protein [Fimbriiglobus ruber]OWK35117.1 hypothetical protein FRUB_09959 [Fimbriiglobus ruber]